MAQRHRSVKRTSRRASFGFEALEDRRLLSSFTLNNQGNLYESTSSGSVDIDSGVVSFAVAVDGTLYDIHGNGVMNEFKNGTLHPFDTGVVSFAIDRNDSVYDLRADQTLHCYNPEASTAAQWSQVATGVTSLASADLGGSIWFLESNSSLWITGDAYGTREISGYGMTELVSAESGRTVYALDSDGLIYRGSDAMGGMGMVTYNNGVAVTGVTQIATADLGGSVWFLEGNSSLWDHGRCLRNSRRSAGMG